MISARIANRRARAIQRGYLQGVPRGYKQILVPEELVGGIKLMLKGKQLHEELNAANGACTHYLSQAIWDAYRKGIISVSQRRTLLRVNKAANSAKHQSSLHGTVGNVVDKQELSLADLLDGPADSRLFSLQSAAFNVLYGDFSVDEASRGISMEAPCPVAHAGWHDDLGPDVTDDTVENNFDSLFDGSVLHEEGTLHDDHRPVVTDFTVENNLDFCNELDDVRKALAEESAKGSLLSGSDVHEDLDQDSLLDGSVLHEALTEDSVQDSLLVGSALHEDDTLHEALTELEHDSLLDGSVLHEALTEDSVQDSLQVGSTLHEDETLHEALTEDSVQDSLLVGSTLHVDATLHDSASSAFAGPLHDKELHDEKVDNEAFARWADVFSSDEDDDFEHELHGHSDFDVIGVSPEFQWQLVDGRWQKFGFSGQRELTCSPDPTLHDNDGDFKDDNSAVVSKFTDTTAEKVDNGGKEALAEDSAISPTFADDASAHLVPFYVPCETVAARIRMATVQTQTRATLDVAYCKAACCDIQRGNVEWRTGFIDYVMQWKRDKESELANLRTAVEDDKQNGTTQHPEVEKMALEAEIANLTAAAADDKQKLVDRLAEVADFFGLHDQLAALQCDGVLQLPSFLLVGNVLAELRQSREDNRQRLANLQDLNTQLVAKLRQLRKVQDSVNEHEHGQVQNCMCKVDDCDPHHSILHDIDASNFLHDFEQLHDLDQMQEILECARGVNSGASPSVSLALGVARHQKGMKKSGNSQKRMKKYIFRANGITGPAAFAETFGLRHDLQ